jgi:hypothetical protein
MPLSHRTSLAASERVTLPFAPPVTLPPELAGGALLTTWPRRRERTARLSRRPPRRGPEPELLDARASSRFLSVGPASMAYQVHSGTSGQPRG